MSILITGIDIPNTMAFRLSFDCGVVFFQPVDKKPRRVYGAKVIQLPAEHGRLIDADALIARIRRAKELQPELSDLYENEAVEMLLWVGTEPTIIEAEEVQDGTL